MKILILHYKSLNQIILILFRLIGKFEMVLQQAVKKGEVTLTENLIGTNNAMLDVSNAIFTLHSYSNIVLWTILPPKSQTT